MTPEQDGFYITASKISFSIPFAAFLMDVVLRLTAPEFALAHRLEFGLAFMLLGAIGVSTGTYGFIVGMGRNRRGVTIRSAIGSGLSTVLLLLSAILVWYAVSAPPLEA